ncbi:hypothetical protein HYU23_03275 [Candidatus Woesearchaeota archaeon]|nr:hypothetical protein [Candidatus Woesearchaeota archaeon]
MSEWIIKEHPYLFKDLDKLDKKELEIFYKKKQKIKQNPLRLEHLSGGENCYREAITNSIRLVYCVKGNDIWLLVIDKHDEAYAEYRKRLYSLRAKYNL